jgi:periplasmic divalent cation tolerance protein
MTDVIQVFTATETREDAEAIAEALVKKRLAVCAQVVAPILSTYWWNGKMEQSEEWLVVIKSTQGAWEALERAIREIHPYKVPEILAVPASHVNESYLAWVRDEIREP